MHRLRWASVDEAKLTKEDGAMSNAFLIKKIIDDIWNRGHVPMICVDARHSDVHVPDHIRKRYTSELNINLNPSDPLNIAFDEEGFFADLAFNHHVERCRFPWKRIYIVVDTFVGQGAVFSAHEPSAADPMNPVSVLQQGIDAAKEEHRKRTAQRNHLAFPSISGEPGAPVNRPNHLKLIKGGKN